MFDMYKPRILRGVYGLCAGGGRGGKREEENCFGSTLLRVGSASFGEGSCFCRTEFSV